MRLADAVTGTPWQVLMRKHSDRFMPRRTYARLLAIDNDMQRDAGLGLSPISFRLRSLAHEGYFIFFITHPLIHLKYI
jgi:hypothetical protein